MLSNFCQTLVQYFVHMLFLEFLKDHFTFDATQNIVVLIAGMNLKDESWKNAFWIIALCTIILMAVIGWYYQREINRTNEAIEQIKYEY